MTIIITVIAFIISFLGVLLVNLSSKRANAIREKLIIKSDPKKDNPLPLSDSQIIELFEKITVRQDKCDIQIMELSELIKSLRVEYEKKKYFKEELFLQTKIEKILRNQYFNYPSLFYNQNIDYISSKERTVKSIEEYSTNLN